MAKKRIGVVLSGCGVYDGAEIHEATLTLYFLDRAGAVAVCMAPDQPQHHVVNHLTGQESAETRNVLVESARIARGKIKPLSAVQAEDLDGLILPGGFGAAKNLSSLALDGPEVQVIPPLAALIKALHQAGKPIGAICIAPAVVAKALANQGILLTIGDDAETTAMIVATGNRHEESTADRIVVDEANRVVSTAAYMCAASIGEAGAGIHQLVEQVVNWTFSPLSEP